MSRIAVISEHASPLAVLGGADGGGQNIYVGQVARHLAALGHAVDVFTRRDDRQSPLCQAWGPNVRIFNVPAGPPRPVPKERLLPYMDAFAAFVDRCMEEEPSGYDVVHANFWMSGWVAQRLRQTRRIPFAITFHALGHVRRLHQGSADGFPAVRTEIEQDIINAADAVIAECPQDRADLLQYYRADPSRIAVVPCGIDPEEVWPVPRDMARVVLGFSPTETLVLQLGRMVPRKGVDTAIRGFGAYVKKYRGEGRLVIVGGETRDGRLVATAESRRLHAIAREERVEDLVTFRGPCNRDELKYYYSAANVFVTMPWYEPFGITPLEAMACGTPVIGSRVGGIKYSVWDGVTGFHVEPDDHVALGDRLADLIHHPDLQEQMGRRGFMRATSTFTWKRVAATLDRIFDRIISGEPVSAPTLDHEIDTPAWQGPERRLQPRKTP